MSDPEQLVITTSDGEAFTVTVQREPSKLAAHGFPATRNVYVMTWDDGCQIDDTRIVRRRQPDAGDGAGRPSARP
jgi:hypothetical protein